VTGAELSALRHELTRRIRTTESAFCVGDWEVSLLHPANSDDLIREEDFVRDERLPYWADIWPSGRLLAAYVRQLDGAGKSLMELGCGAGLVATAAAFAGFEVCATDYYDDALDFTKVNVAANTRRNATTRLVDWRDMPTDLGRFDYVVGSDVLYEKEYGELVARAIDMTLKRDGEAIIADPGRIAVDDFVRNAAERGLRVASRDELPFVEGAIRQTINIYRLRR
jgi:predicted nicotinamide N-methyase